MSFPCWTVRQSDLAKQKRESKTKIHFSFETYPVTSIWISQWFPSTDHIFIPGTSQQHCKQKVPSCWPWCERWGAVEMARIWSPVQVSFLQIHLCFLRSCLNYPLTPGETLQMSHFWHALFNEPLDLMSIVLLLSRNRARKQSLGWSWATWVFSAGFLEKNQGKLILLLRFV